MKVASLSWTLLFLSSGFAHSIDLFGDHILGDLTILPSLGQRNFEEGECLYNLTTCNEVVQTLQENFQDEDEIGFTSSECVENPDGNYSFTQTARLNATCPVCGVETNLCISYFQVGYNLCNVARLEYFDVSMNVFGGARIQTTLNDDDQTCTHVLNGVECNSCNFVDLCDNDCSNVIPEAKITCDDETIVTNCP